MELREIMRTLYGIEQPKGCTDQEIDSVRKIFGAIPATVEEFWRTVGRTKELNQAQDTWLLPEDYQKWKWLTEYECLLLLSENQGVCRSGIRREDLTLPDPPVYTRMEDDDPWLLSAPTTSEFLEAVLTYEAVWLMEYSLKDYFWYWLTDEELETVQAKLTRRPITLRNWMEYEFTFYSNRPDNLVVVMDVGGQYQCFWAGATQEGYAALLEVMEGLGEPV